MSDSASHTHMLADPGHTHSCAQLEAGGHAHGLPGLAPADDRRTPETVVLVMTPTIDMAEFIAEMQKAVAEALNVPQRLLAGGERGSDWPDHCDWPWHVGPRDDDAEGQRLLTVAAFPHTPE